MNSTLVYFRGTVRGSKLGERKVTPKRIYGLACTKGEICVVGSILINNIEESNMKNCPKCNAEFEPVIKWGYEPTYCSRSCANGKKWTDADKLKKSLAAKASDKVLAANTATEKRERISVASSAMHKDGRGVPPSAEAQHKGSLTAAKNRHAKMMGLDATVRRNYRRLCQFDFNLGDYPTEFDFGLIQQFGWYSASNKGNNADGVSRDHMLSVSDGWKLGIDPSKIRHPANCRLVQHIENWNKRATSILTESELDDRIARWENTWGTGKGAGEHLQCS